MLWGCGAGEGLRTPPDVEIGSQGAAISGIRASLEANRKARNRPGELADLINLGKALCSSGAHNDALDELARAVKLANKLKDPKAQAEAHAAYALASLEAGSPEKALESVEKAIEIDFKSGEQSQARLNLKGLALIRSGRPGDALDVLKSSTSIEGGGKELLAEAMRLSGTASRQTNGNALWYFSEAYRLDRELGSTEKAAFDLDQLAELNFEQGRYDEAVFLFERSYSAYLQAGSTDMAIKGLDKLIEATEGLGRRDKAVHYIGIREDLLRKRTPGGDAR